MTVAGVSIGVEDKPPALLADVLEGVTLHKVLEERWGGTAAESLLKADPEVMMLTLTRPRLAVVTPFISVRPRRRLMVKGGCHSTFS